MTAKTIVILLLLSAILIIGAQFLKSTKIEKLPIKTSALETPPAKIENLIFMDEKGFQPANLEIKIGEKITFVNRGQKSHWPASDLHPTHQIYPEFDPKKPISAGDQWSFIFNQTGTWKFHDHLSAKLTGIITVKNSDGSLKLESQIIKKNPVAKAPLPVPPPNSENLLANINMLLTAKNLEELRAWLKSIGPKKVMEDLLRDSGNGSTIDCHQEAHNIGRLAFEIYGSRAFKDGNSSCHSGYYHGAIEAFLKENGADNLAQKSVELCNAFDTSFGRFECLHGLGHGILAYEDYDLPKGLAVCRELGNSYDTNSCYGGMFMENIVTGQGLGAGAAHETRWINRDPHFPCNSIGNDYDVRYQCYQMQTSWMLTLVNYDFDKVKNECAQAPKDMLSVCFKSFGRDAAGHTLRNVSKIIEICGKIIDNDEYYPQCVIGAVNVIVDFWGDGLKNQATELCRALPEKGKSTCYSTLSWRLNDIFKTNREKKLVCDNFEENYKSLCVNGS